VEELRDRNDVALRVVRQRRVDQRVHRERRGVAHEQRMPVRRRGPHLAERDDAGSAGLVLDDHRLVPLAAQVLRDRARDDVGTDADRVRHDDAHRPRRECRLGARA
jgi:hypothetical protein